MAKKQMSLYEVMCDGVTALIFAQRKREAIKFFKDEFRHFPVLNIDNHERLGDSWNNEGWRDDLGFEVNHIGSKAKDWHFGKNPTPMLYSFHFEHQI